MLTMAMPREQYLEAMSRSAATVAVVATDGPAGRAGVTVSTLCSVSADPPQLLVCVHHESAACDALRRNGRFSVNVLRDDQWAISDRFAGRGGATDGSPDGDKFAGAEWTALSTGAPALLGALAAYDCRLARHLRCGSHVIFIGDVVDVVIGDAEAAGGGALVYANRAYATAQPLAAQAA